MADDYTKFNMSSEGEDDIFARGNSSPGASVPDSVYDIDKIYADFSALGDELLGEIDSAFYDAADVRKMQQETARKHADALVQQQARTRIRYDMELAAAKQRADREDEEIQKNAEARLHSLALDAINREVSEFSPIGDTEPGFFTSLYDIIYDLGLGVIKAIKKLIGFFVNLIVRPIKAFNRAAGLEWQRYFRSFAGSVSAEVKAFKDFFRDIGHARKRRKGSDGLPEYTESDVRNHNHVLGTIGNFVLPVACIVLLIFTVKQINSSTYALEVRYNGKSIGYISGESVYLEAQELLKERLDLEALPEGAEGLALDADYALNKVSYSELCDAETICDHVIENSDGSYVSACGVYIDGKFAGAVRNEADAKNVFYNLLQPYEAEAEKGGYIVGLADDVEYVQSLYADLPEIVLDASTFTEHVEGVAGDGSDSLVKIQKIVTSTRIEEVEFDTVEKKDISKYVGYEVVSKPGEVGYNRVTTTKIYIDGELDDVRIDTVVLKASVPQEVTVGARHYGYDIGDKSAFGFLWPAPECHSISSPYGYRSSGFHKGVDLITYGGGALGTPVIASMSGTVEYAGWSDIGYGYMVLINHGNGYKTRYGHMISDPMVSEGEYVYAGQQLGKVGSTGNSTGPHLHFEIIVYGEMVDPMKYIGDLY